MKYIDPSTHILDLVEAGIVSVFTDLKYVHFKEY